MKFKAPDNCNEVNVGGQVYKVAKDGSVTVPDDGDYSAMLKPHGFTQWNEPEAEVEVEKPQAQAAVHKSSKK